MNAIGSSMMKSVSAALPGGATNGGKDGPRVRRTRSWNYKTTAATATTTTAAAATATATTTTTAPTKLSNLPTLFLIACFGAVCFYLGLLTGSSTRRDDCPMAMDEVLQQQYLQQKLRNTFEAYRTDPSRTTLPQDDTNNNPAAAAAAVAGANVSSQRFPVGVHKFAVGMATVSRNDFAKFFQLGVPLDESTTTNQHVLILYSQMASLPSSNASLANAAASDKAIPRVDSIQQATENCDYLNLILTDHSAKRRQCVAIMGQYEAFHIQKYMRLPGRGQERGMLNHSLPLRFVNRGAHANGRLSAKIPSQNATNQFWDLLTNYLHHLPGLLEELRPIAAKQAAAGNYPNTIVVLVCNFGQSELLQNFLCLAVQRNLDLSSVLVFCTDEETLQLVQAYAAHTGIAAFYSETIFGSMPKRAARRYGDSSFMAMMMAKVYVVHLLTLLGHDLLFQDVDVIWYRNPLEYFVDPSSLAPYYDIYFQDDGNHEIFYSPYSANTGFYFVRANDHTRHFFNSFLLAGDLIIVTRSHQIPLVAWLQEHASMFGLQIKIFDRMENDFPGGHAFHYRRSFMKDLLAGREKPYIFHMSWTLNKENKRKYYQQMGEWVLSDTCLHKTADQILGVDSNQNNKNILQACCLKEPNFQCHYRDKPSKRPCHTSPMIDGPKGRPFWP